MKLVIRSELPAELQAELKDSRFVLMEPSEWGVPKILAHGNDPVLVSQGGVAPKFGGDGKTPNAPHRLHHTGQVELATGVLYRIDESRRAS